MGRCAPHVPCAGGEAHLSDGLAQEGDSHSDPPLPALGGGFQMIGKNVIFRERRGLHLDTVLREGLSYKILSTGHRLYLPKTFNISLGTIR